MKIICGTDFSENSEQAAIAAAAIARRLDDRLILAHVTDETLLTSLPEDVRKTAAASTAEQLQDAVRRLRPISVRVEEHVLSGRPDEALTKLASGPEVRLLVMASL